VASDIRTAARLSLPAAAGERFRSSYNFEDTSRHENSLSLLSFLLFPYSLCLSVTTSATELPDDF
jgi:hypothetical protein